jgi:hypothetical protein
MQDATGGRIVDAEGVGKATASGILHRAEGIIIREFLGESVL